jgi:hypothetical protein
MYAAFVERLAERDVGGDQRHRHREQQRVPGSVTEGVVHLRDGHPHGRGHVLALLVGAATWLADGVKLVVDGLRAAVETGLYWRNYRIAVEVPAPRPSPAPAPSPAVPSFVGEWHVHGTQFVISSATAGYSIIDAGPCGPMPGPRCMERDEYGFRLSPDGQKLTATITSVTVTEAGTGRQRPDVAPFGHPTETYALTFAGPNLLIRNPWERGNPYLCNDQTSKIDLPKCGA